MSEPPIQLSDVDPAQFAKTVAETPREQLAEGMASELRVQVLDEIFRRMEDHFDPAQSADVNIVVHFTITGQDGPEPDKFQVIVRDGTCKTGRELTESAELGLELDAVDFLWMVADLTTGMSLYLEGKLKIDGNMILAGRLAGLFAMPDAGAAGSQAPATTSTQTQGE